MEERASGAHLRELATPRHRSRSVPEQRYECMVHGIGLEEENPSVCNPSDPQPNAETVIERDMALVIEIYAGAVGARDGVKLGDQVVVTDTRCRVLAPFPFTADSSPDLGLDGSDHDLAYFTGQLFNKEVE